MPSLHKHTLEHEAEYGNEHLHIRELPEATLDILFRHFDLFGVVGK